MSEACGGFFSGGGRPSPTSAGSSTRAWKAVEKKNDISGDHVETKGPFLLKLRRKMRTSVSGVNDASTRGQESNVDDGRRHIVNYLIASHQLAQTVIKNFCYWFFLLSPQSYVSESDSNTAPLGGHRYCTTWFIYL